MLGSTLSPLLGTHFFDDSGLDTAFDGPGVSTGSGHGTDPGGMTFTVTPAQASVHNDDTDDALTSSGASSSDSDSSSVDQQLEQLVQLAPSPTMAARSSYRSSMSPSRSRWHQSSGLQSPDTTRVPSSTPAIVREKIRIREADSRWPEYVLRAEMHVVNIWIQQQGLSDEDATALKQARRRFRGRNYTCRSRHSKKLLIEQVAALEAGLAKHRRELKAAHAENTRLRERLRHMEAILAVDTSDPVGTVALF